jgi:hypothetical protein
LNRRERKIEKTGFRKALISCLGPFSEGEGKWKETISELS